MSEQQTTTQGEPNPGSATAQPAVATPASPQTTPIPASDPFTTIAQAFPQATMAQANAVKAVMSEFAQMAAKDAMALARARNPELFQAPARDVEPPSVTPRSPQQLTPPPNPSPPPAPQLTATEKAEKAQVDLHQTMKTPGLHRNLREAAVRDYFAQRKESGRVGIR